MLSSICTSRRSILACVKLRSRVLTALNLLPSIATLASLNSSRRRHSITNSRQTRRVASPLSLRKSAIVLKSGIRRPVSHTNSMLRWHSRQAPARVHPIEVSVDVNLQQRRRMVGRPSCRLWLDAAKAQLHHIKLIDKDIDRPDRIVLAQIVIQPLRKQSALAAVIANHKARHRIPPPNRRGIISAKAFSHSLGQIEKSSQRAMFPLPSKADCDRRTRSKITTRVLRFAQ